MWLEASERGRLLDVGTGSGDFVAQMQELGWQAAGLDPDPVVVRAASSSLGRDIALGTLEEAAFAEGSFDTVTMSHVIEHLPDPIRTLVECRRVLKEGGRLVLLTPNIDSL
jgi:2-polyprenyl-3-methyl-5-hydroxy-6-metoxy-1,4-benzoquinol methylase